MIDGDIKEKTYEALANFKGRSTWGLRCFGTIEIVDGYLAIGLSSMDYDPESSEANK